MFYYMDLLVLGKTTLNIIYEVVFEALYVGLPTGKCVVKLLSPVAAAGCRPTSSLSMRRM